MVTNGRPDGSQAAGGSQLHRRTQGKSNSGTPVDQNARVDADDRAGKPSPRENRPRRETAARREDILRAAMRTFGSKGYHNGSLVEVAEQVGITHSGVLHHFGSKVRLLWAVLEYRDQADLADLQRDHVPGGLDLFRHLVRTAQINTERRGLVQAYAVLTGESVTDGHPASDWVRHRFTALRDDIVDALRTIISERAIAQEAAIGDPEFSDEALSRAASAIIALMDGLQVQWLLDPDAVDLAASTAFAIEAILAAALAGSAMPHMITAEN